MPQLTSNFIFKSKQPNFERDSIKTLEGLRTAKPAHYDVGHIVYCQEDGNHYKYVGEKGAYNNTTGYFQLFNGSVDVSEAYTGLTLNDIDELLGFDEEDE